jgi:hypothetical protein
MNDVMMEFNGWVRIRLGIKDILVRRVYRGDGRDL